MKEIEKSVYRSGGIRRSLVDLLKSKGESGYIPKKIIEKYLEEHRSKFWDDPDYSSKILWINGISITKIFITRASWTPSLSTRTIT